MNTKKFIVVGLISMLALTGCFNQNAPANSEAVEPTTQAVETKSLGEQEAKEAEEAEVKAAAEVAEKEAEAKAAAEVAEKEAEAKAAAEVVEKNQSAIKDLIALGKLIGKKQADVINLLGKAESTENLEDTNILLADYYKQTILDQAVKVEIVYNDNKGEVNFINMTCKQTDDVEAFVEAIAKELTTEFGESSIEKITNVRGTRRRQWQDSTLTYVLSYVEDTVTFDMYSTDK
ncbi:hypothetical protein [Cellulosilyticum lentocellum]|nr:hypothetical protein [Cellulosilyticum lentocellum]